VGLRKNDPALSCAEPKIVDATNRFVSGNGDGMHVRQDQVLCIEPLSNRGDKITVTCGGTSKTVSAP
jgi:hypothetical protein